MWPINVLANSVAHSCVNDVTLTYHGMGVTIEGAFVLGTNDLGGTNVGTRDLRLLVHSHVTMCWSRVIYTRFCISDNL